MTPTKQRYLQLCHTQSDIQHHLPLLYSLARGNVVELGTRTGVSTAALLAGVEDHAGWVLSIDVDDCSELFKGHPQWEFMRGDSTDTGVAMAAYAKGAPFYLALIDTLHTTEQVSVELDLWWPHIAPGGTICVHDTETFPGVRRAITEFCDARGWSVTYVLPCNGMAVIEVPG